MHAEFHAQHARCFATTRNAYLLNHAQAERLLSGEEAQQRTRALLAALAVGSGVTVCAWAGGVLILSGLAVRCHAIDMACSVRVACDGSAPKVPPWRWAAVPAHCRSTYLTQLSQRLQDSHCALVFTPLSDRATRYARISLYSCNYC